MSDSIIQGLLNVERWNDQFRQPNPNGRYPICKPIVGDRNDSRQPVQPFEFEVEY